MKAQAQVQGQIQGWSQSGTLTTGDPNQTVSMQCQLEPDNYTVQFFCDPPPTGAMTEAIITWTVNGNPIQRRVTVGQGTSVTGSGAAVKVQMVDTTDTSNYNFAAGKKYGVSVSVTRGTRGPDQMPPVLVPGAQTDPSGLVNQGPGAYTVPPATVFVVQIPQGVGIVSAFVTAIDLNAGAVLITNANAQVLAESTFVSSIPFAPNAGVWVPLPPGINELALINRIGGGGHSITFGVVFGVDG